MKVDDRYQRTNVQMRGCKYVVINEFSDEWKKLSNVRCV